MIFPEFSLLSGASGSFRRSVCEWMDLRKWHVTKCQRHRAFMFSQHSFQSAFHLAAEGTLEIRKFHDHDLGFGVSSHPRGIESYLDAGSTQQYGNFCLLAKARRIFLTRLLNPRPFQRLRQLWFHFIEWTILVLLNRINGVQFHVGRFRNLGIDFLLQEFVGRKSLFLRFTVKYSLCD